jgi:hypothetical protein
MDDWVMAENTVITQQYQRQIQADLSLMTSVTELESTDLQNSVCITAQEYDVCHFLPVMSVNLSTGYIMHLPGFELFSSECMTVLFSCVSSFGSC